VDAIISPLACGRVSLGLSAVYRYHRDLDGIPETGEGRRLGNMSAKGGFLSRGQVVRGENEGGENVRGGERERELRSGRG
jgi:hypothetical protein